MHFTVYVFSLNLKDLKSGCREQELEVRSGKQALGLLKTLRPGTVCPSKGKEKSSASQPLGHTSWT